MLHSRAIIVPDTSEAFLINNLQKEGWSDINKGVEEYRGTRDAVLLDVRTPQEYREGHIPGSKNVPLQQLDKISAVAHNKGTALFVCCYSGGRSRQAASVLRHMGYTNVQNIGGIAAYSGRVER